MAIVDHSRTFWDTQAEARALSGRGGRVGAEPWLPRKWTSSLEAHLHSSPSPSVEGKGGLQQSGRVAPVFGKICECLSQMGPSLDPVATTPSSEKVSEVKGCNQVTWQAPRAGGMRRYWGQGSRLKQLKGGSVYLSPRLQELTVHHSRDTSW